MTVSESTQQKRRRIVSKSFGSASFLISMYLIHAAAVAVCFLQLTWQRLLQPSRNRSGAPRDLPRVPEPSELQPSSAALMPAHLAEPDVPLTINPEGAKPQLWDTQLLEYTHDAIIIWELHGAGILYWNRAAEQLYGYKRCEAHGKTTHRLLKTQLAGGVTRLESHLARFGVWVGELRHTTRDGRRVDVEGRLALMSQQNGLWLVLEVNRDITDHKAADAARCAMERQLAQLRALQEVDRDEG